MIGSARLTDEKVVAISHDIGQILARSGMNLVCGGLGGVMLEVCRGFKSIKSEGSTVGILPSYDASTANDYIDVVIPTGLDVGRNQIVVASASVVIVIGGGAGTLSEIAIASQINKPIILIKNTGGWADKINDDYLDNRKNARIYHVDDLQKLEALIKKLIEDSTQKPGKINSGHNNEINYTR